MTNLYTVKTSSSDKTKNEFGFAFHDRDSYLKWVADWKAEIKRLSAEQRTLKREIARKQQAGEYAGREQWQLVKNSSQITEMLQARVASKLEAKRQYEASKAALAAE